MQRRGQREREGERGVCREADFMKEKKERQNDGEKWSESKGETSRKEKHIKGGIVSRGGGGGGGQPGD